MKLVSILVITFFNFAQARDIYCPSVLENNIDYFGNDISLEFTETVDQCCTLCYENSDCTSFTFARFTKSCWLKNFTSNFLNRVSAFGRLSGSIKVHETTRAPLPTQPIFTRPVKTIISTSLFSCITEKNIYYNTKTINQYKVKTISECCDLCGRSPLCLAWTYLVEVEFCLLKSNPPADDQKSISSNTISGILYH